MEALIVSTYLLMRANPFWCMSVAGMLMFSAAEPARPKR
jgi:hypothetical protein